MKNEIDKLFRLINKYGITSKNYPTYLEDKFQIAISAKRSGNYELSLSIINDLIESERHAYTGILNGAFKTVAASGYIRETIDILKMCNRAMQTSFYGMNNFSDHLERIKNAIYSEGSLTQYLRSISGNPNYRLPRDYWTIISEIS